MNLKRNTVTALRNVLRQYSTIRSSWEILYYYFEEIQPTSLMLQKYDGYWTPRIMSTKSGNSKRRNPNKVRTHFSRIRNKRAGSRKIKQNVFSRWNILKNCWRLCLEQHHSAQIILLQDDIPRYRFSEEGLDHHSYHFYHPDHHHHHHHYSSIHFQDRLMTYQDSGFSEEDQDHQVTTCLMKTPSGSIYIQPTSELVMVVVMMMTMMMVVVVMMMVTHTNSDQVNWISSSKEKLLLEKLVSTSSNNEGPTFYMNSFTRHVYLGFKWP